MMMAAAFAAAFGAIQQTPRMVPGLPEVRAWRVRRSSRRSARCSLIRVRWPRGRFLLAFLAVRIVSRRKLIRLFQVPGVVLMPIVFAVVATRSLTLLEWASLSPRDDDRPVQLLGELPAAVYPTYLRGTGESFAANVGGRMIGTCAALLTTQLTNIMPVPRCRPGSRTRRRSSHRGVRHRSHGEFLLPEPSREELPE